MSDETTVGERLRGERARLGYNIRDFAEIGGITKSTQSSYENDKTLPNSEYLNRISAKGAEIFWIMSGSREDDEVREKRAAMYPPEITDFIENYKLCPEAVKASLRAIAADSADKARLEIKEWNKKQREKKK
ncbi:MAG: helix-turn-helix domain-containing protein [Gallionella sp.]|nr:helix-turn-helix domain-containing protein [Gallionella sp.]MDD4947600.1 helix-turn-helix domain-containing protein [Gallionella sp.]